MASAESRANKLYQQVQNDENLKEVFDADQEGWAKANPNSMGTAKDKIAFLAKIIKDNTKPANLLNEKC